MCTHCMNLHNMGHINSEPLAGRISHKASMKEVSERRKKKKKSEDDGNKTINDVSVRRKKTKKKAEDDIESATTNTGNSDVEKSMRRRIKRIGLSCERSLRSVRKTRVKKTNTQLDKTSLDGMKDVDPRERKKKLDEIEKPSAEQMERFNKLAAEILHLGIEGLLKEFETEIRGFYSPNCYRQGFDANMKCNRYKDVICLDKTRVMLRTAPDYIHANWIRTDYLLNTFICTQGPLPNTLNEFWRMIVQEKVGNIFMLCQVMELGKKKSEPYFPAQQGQTLTFGQYTITCVQHDTSDRHITQTNLKVTEGGKEVTTLKHHQWITWPDRSVPTSLLAAFRLLRISRNSRFPTLVHCSAGVGRTGSVVALEMIIMKSLMTDSFKMFNIVKQLRGMRAQSVQTDIQYVFLGMAILNYLKELVILKEEYWPKYNEFKDKYEALAAVRQAEEESKMKAADAVEAASKGGDKKKEGDDVCGCANGSTPPPPPMPEAAGTGFDIGLPATGTIIGANTAQGTGEKS